ncbi:MAG TPA: cupin domain-containing protein [Candidatus Polarisedimenticolia bacterium]|nr:cupin domain-containing protein [Candidatus Polarisedimenticolia bacterium]
MEVLQHEQGSHTKTLAQVLDALKADACVPEKYWVDLVHALARGDQLALNALYLRTSRLVFTWVLRITANRKSAEEETLEVYLDLWHGASSYDPSDGSVLAWIMNHARARAMNRLASPAPASRSPGEVSFTSLWRRLARRVAAEAGRAVVVSPYEGPETVWEEVAPGLSCALLAKDDSRGTVSMLVRMAPGVEYPPHTHAGVEELYMFEGDLTVDDKHLVAGDYLRSEPGSSDHRVRTATGCSGVLITSSRDLLL